MEREVDELFDCFELPAVPGGFRPYLTDGISRYLGIRFELNGARYEAMKEYPEAFCRLVRAVADEARKLKDEGIPPFDNSEDQRGTKRKAEKVEVTFLIRSLSYYRTYINTMSEKQAERLLKRWKKLSKEDKELSGIDAGAGDGETEAPGGCAQSRTGEEHGKEEGGRLMRKGEKEIGEMFENEETAVIIQKKLLPALEELARAEFGTYSMTGNIDEETTKWMGEKGEQIITVAKQYMTGLMHAHIRAGIQIRELERGCKNLGGDSDDVGD